MCVRKYFGGRKLFIFAPHTVQARSKFLTQRSSVNAVGFFEPHMSRNASHLAVLRRSSEAHKVSISWNIQFSEASY